MAAKAGLPLGAIRPRLERTTQRGGVEKAEKVYHLLGFIPLDIFLTVVDGPVRHKHDLRSGESPTQIRFKRVATL